MLDKDQGAYEIDLLVINCDRTLVAAATTSSKCERYYQERWYNGVFTMPNSDSYTDSYEV